MSFLGLGPRGFSGVSPRSWAHVRVPNPIDRPGMGEVLVAARQSQEWARHQGPDELAFVVVYHEAEV